jgi:hypothetical protein
MLTHMRGQSEGPPLRWTHDTARNAAAKARARTIRRVCIGALKVLAVGGVLAAIIALQAAIYYWRFLH